MEKINEGDEVVLTFNTEINGAVITKEDIGTVVDLIDEAFTDRRYVVAWHQYLDEDGATPHLWVSSDEIRKVA